MERGERRKGKKEKGEKEGKWGGFSRGKGGRIMSLLIMSKNFVRLTYRQSDS